MPHFTIEAEGGTNPLDARTVYDTLAQASGYSGPQALTVATEQLSNWQRQPGFYSALQDVYTNLSYDQTIRYQAIIQLKNGIDKHWRKGSSNAIGKEEKLKIRSTAIEAGLRESSHPLSLQNALLIGKIVRSDYPHDWPDVINDLLDCLRAAAKPEVTPLYVGNILTITLHVIKALATGGLPRTKKNLQSVAPELLEVLRVLLIKSYGKWFANNDSSTGVLDGDAQSSAQAMKAIRRLIIHGFEHPHRDSTVQRIWSFFEHQQVTLRNQWQQSEVVAKHLLQMSKLHLDMARIHPASFILLPNALIFLKFYWMTITELGKKLGSEMTLSKKWKVGNDGDRIEDTPTLEKLALKGLLLLRACIKMVYQPTQTFKYQQPQDKEDKKTAVEVVRTQVLTENFILNMMNTVVTQYFILRPSDLRDWEEEPDEWEKREEEIADAWEFSLRSCSEKLFLELVINYKELLVPRLLHVFYQYATPSNTDILLKDSLYAAVGIAAPCLVDQLDFNAFLLQTLVPEVQISETPYKLLRRRIAILLGQWVPVKPDSFDRRSIYQIFTHLLSNADGLNDMVVRVTAGRQLRLVLEPFEFDQAEFTPFAPPIFESLMFLIRETELSETKLALLETVRVAVTRLEGHIEPYSDAIMSMLPGLWADSGEEGLMKQAILTMISAIVSSLKQKSLKYHSAILPLLRDSVLPDPEGALYLLPDAIDLWTAVVQQTPSDNPPPSAELLALSANLVHLAELGSESLGQVFDLIESYILLSPSTMVSPHILNPLLTNICPMFAADGRSRTGDFQKASRVIETLISSLSLVKHFATFNDAEQALKQILSSTVDTSFLPTILQNLKLAYTYHLDPRPSRQPPDVVGPKETNLFNILSHMAIVNPRVFWDALEQTPTFDQEGALPWLITEWISNFDAIGGVQEKKLQTIAISRLLHSASSRNRKATIMLEQLQSILTIWTDVTIALGEDAPEGTFGDYLWYGRRYYDHGPSRGLTAKPDTGEKKLVWVDEAPEEERRREFDDVDPVHRENIRFDLRQELHRLLHIIGPDVFQRQWLSRCDSAVVEGFARLGFFQPGQLG